MSGEDFGRYIGEIGKAASALTGKAAIVAALKANGDAFATQLESLTRGAARPRW